MKIEKNKFYHHESPIFLKDVDIKKVLIPKKISSGKKSYKYFIGYWYSDYKVKLLHVMLPKTSTYVKSYDWQTKWVHFLIEDGDLLAKYNTIWYEVSADIQKEFDSEPVYNKKFLKTKIKFHGDEGTSIYDKEIPEVDSNHTCLAVISLDSVLKKR